MSDESGQSVSAFLSSIVEEDARKVTESLLHSVLQIGELLRSGGTTSSLSATTGGTASEEEGEGGGGQNAFGDTQLEIDVRADDMIRESLRATGVAYSCSSEERPTEDVLNENGTLCVSYDPLDGSSVMSSNFAVGSIFAVWRTADRRIVGHTGRSIILSMAAVYGHRLSVMIGGSALRDSGVVYEASLYGELRRVGNSVRALHGSRLKKKQEGSEEKGKGKLLFAPANLRAARDLPRYAQLVTEHYMKQGYTLRYTGAMVPDVTQLLVRGYGVFVSPVSGRAKAKLRLIYEVAPMAVLVEAAGGRSSDCVHREQSILDVTVETCEDRIGCCLGSVEEVERFEKTCLQ